MARRKRGLTAEDTELWEKVKLATTPMVKSRPKKIDEVEPQPVFKPKVAQPKTRIQPFQLGQNAKPTKAMNKLAPSMRDEISKQPVQMDKKAYTKLTRGRLLPEAKIDLHGMTLDRAHPALNAFIQRSYGQGLRLVLVVTGKGKIKEDHGPIPSRIGVLRHQVPMWLNQMPLKPLVMQITHAHGKHGGGGAYYVYLRRQR
ncbi:MAG: Smr/MutS family protein [Paracoccaceae bacterium]|nr:Smr/MutS family protein [Paracoccaceae bacterium]